MRTPRRILGMIFVFLIGSGQARAIPVTGTVATSDGTALAGARAELVPVASHLERTRDFLDGRTRGEPVAVATSDGSGRFVLEAPLPGLYSVTLRAPGHLGGELVPLVLTEAHELPPARLEGDAGSSVEVRDTSGKPLAGAWVFARRSGLHGVRGFGPEPRLRQTDARGRAVLPRAAGERLDVSLYVPERGHFDERRAVTRASFTVPRAAGERYVVEVRGDDERPLAGVAVALGQAAWPVGVTDETGRLVLAVSGLERPDVMLVAESGRRARALLDRPLVRVVLPAPETTRGRVLSQDGHHPVARALVWPTSDPGAYTSSDAEGRYALNVPGQGRRLRVDAAGFLPARIEARPKAADVLLEAARPAFGRVVDPDGRPLAGVEVAVTSTGARPGTDGILVATGGAGRFRITHLGAERVDLLARRRGYAPTLARGVRAARSEPEPEVDLGTLVLVPGAAILGQVRDTDGEPIVGADVWLSTDLDVPAEDLLAVETGELPAAHSDAAGTFAVEDLEPGSRSHLRIAADGFLPVVKAAVGAPTKAPLEVVLVRAAGLSGRVTDEDGAAVAGAAVTLSPPPAPGHLEMPLLGREHHHETVTEADGRFTFDTLAAGSFEVAVAAGGYVAPPHREVTVSASGKAPELAFVLERGATLRGRVTTTGGEPLAGARIAVADALGSSDDEGFYLTAGIAPGRHQARVYHSVLNGAAAELDFEDDRDQVHDFVLEAGHGVEGRVVDDAGTPVAGARVSFDQQDWGNPHHLAVLSGEDGSFHFPQVAEGRYRVSVEKSGYAFAELSTPVEVGDAAVEGVEVVMPRGTLVRGRIFGLEADELTGVRIQARQPDGPALDGMVDYEGAFEIRDAGPGDWLLVATTSDLGREARARVAVDPGEREHERDLEFGGGHTLEGRVLFGDEPLAGARLSLTGHGLALERRLLADHEGVFRLRDLPRGTYRLAASHPRHLLLANREVTVPDDSPVTIRIEGAKVHGYVRGTDARPLAGALVALHQVLEGGAGGSLYSLNADDEGYFALPRLSAGRYRISVHQDGYEHLEEELELAAGVETGPLYYELEPTAGLTFQLAADGPLPSEVTVTVDGLGGRRVESRWVDSEGRVSFPTVAAGTWDVVVSALGRAAQALKVTVPSEPVPLSLAPGGRLRVRVSDLVESRHASQESVAALRLLDETGAPLLALDEHGIPGRVWGMAGGTAVVDGVPPGRWTVQVETADGQRWSSPVVLGGQLLSGAGTEVLLEGGRVLTR